MCGICGLLRPSDTEPIEREFLQRMNRTLHHRGPDSEGYYLSKQIGLAVSRLAIIDVAGGHQPISNEDSSIFVVFNGEIYNFREIRAQLQLAGHSFSTNSDTEVVVHAYEEWGDAALDHFNGMFAFALWDERRERLLLARDRMGKKPLYWHYSAQGLLWGSEARALLVAPWVDRRVHALALHHYLTLQYVPDPLTIFEGIHRLPAAHKLVVERGTDPKVSRWWQLKFEPKWKMTDEDAIKQARTLLENSVEHRLIAEVPLGAFLSGGIDSSIVVALMARRSAQPVKTFSIGFEEMEYTETHYARQIAEQYQTDHHEFIFRSQDLTRIIEETIVASGEPLADPAALPLFELARQARQSVTVALCGDGGDETLAGYQRYRLDSLFRTYTALPEWITQCIVPAVTRLLPEPTWIPEDRNFITGLKRLRQFAATTSKASIVRWGSYFNHDQKMALYNDDLRNQLAAVETADWIASAYDEAHAINMLDRTLYADHVTYLSGDLLPKTDLMTMAHSLEARAPLLDVDWVEWTARLPRRFKVRHGKTKWLLRAAFPDLVPKSIRFRSKQGLGVPVGNWFRKELKNWARERLLSNSLSEWFQPAVVERLLVEHNGGIINHGKRLWALVVFAQWLESAFTKPQPI